MEFSKDYYELVEKSKQYHLENKTWGGLHMLPYGPFIKELADKYQIESILDYGCGKGRQYSENHEWESGISTSFDKYIGVNSVYKFDPCWNEFCQAPSSDQSFDAVIMIQAIGFIPDADMPYFVNRLMTYTKKFCFIGEQHPSKPVKEKKKKNLNPEAFKVVRTENWYYEQFKDWTGSELIFKFL